MPRWLGAEGTWHGPPILPAHNSAPHSSAPSFKRVLAWGGCKSVPGISCFASPEFMGRSWAALTHTHPDPSREPPSTLSYLMECPSVGLLPGEVQQVSKPNGLQLLPPHSSTKPTQGLSSLSCPRKPFGLSPNPTFPVVQHDICPLGTSPECPSACPVTKRCSHHHHTHPPVQSSVSRAEGRAKAAPGCSKG